MRWKPSSARKGATDGKPPVGHLAHSRPSTRDRILLATALRDFDRRLTEAEALADTNLAASREMLAARK